MCHLVTSAANGKDGDPRVQQDIQRIIGQPDSPYLPLTPAELAQHVLHTSYMGTKNSSEATSSRASRLAAQVGSYHLEMKIDSMVESVVLAFQFITGRRPEFTLHGGTNAEDLALQNIQARLRMVMSYLLAQLLPWTRQKSGFLLVLGSANVDEGKVYS